jgi:hypothetical protein
MLGQVAVEQQVIARQEAVVAIAAARFEGYQLMREAQPSTPLVAQQE